MTDPHRTNPAPINRSGPTPYAEVNGVLGEVLAGIQAALGERLCGVYLFGSLVTGDFDPRRSDVDVLIVTDADLSTDQFAALDAVHRTIAAGDSPWAAEVEAYYLTRAALRRDGPSYGWHLKVNRGNNGILEPLHLDSAWLIQGHLLREYGVALVGPDPRTLVEPVAPRRFAPNDRGERSRVVGTAARRCRLIAPRGFSYVPGSHALPRALYPGE